MFVTKRKYEKLARDYQRLFWEYIKIASTDTEPKKTQYVKKAVAKKTTTKKAG